MSAGIWLGIGLLGGLGALARFLLDGAVSLRLGRSFPWGTLVVNLTGALALSVLAGAALPSSQYALAGTGAIGGYTTFSTWMYESHRLAEDGELRLGALNLAISLVWGVAVAALGLWIGRRL